MLELLPRSVDLCDRWFGPGIPPGLVLVMNAERVFPANHDSKWPDDHDIKNRQEESGLHVSDLSRGMLPSLEGPAKHDYYFFSLLDWASANFRSDQPALEFIRPSG
jgi:hypothetical protein